MLTPCRRDGAVLWAPHCQPLPRHQLRWVLGLCHPAGNARHRAACGLRAGSRGQEVLGAALGAPTTPSCPDPGPRCRRGALGGAGRAGGALLFLVPSTPNALQKKLSRLGCDFHRMLFTSGVRGDAGWRRDLRGCLRDLFWVLLPLPRVTAGHGESCTCPPEAAARLARGTPGVGEQNRSGAARLPRGNVPEGGCCVCHRAPPADAAPPRHRLGFLPMPPQSSQQVPAASCLIAEAKTIALWLLCSELFPKTRGLVAWHSLGTRRPLGFVPSPASTVALGVLRPRVMQWGQPKRGLWV